jgi:flagellar basal body-associated protein FliL
MASNFAFEFTSTEKTPNGERKKSLKIRLAVGAVMISLAAAILAAAGYINREDLPYFLGKPAAEKLHRAPPET